MVRDTQAPRAAEPVGGFSLTTDYADSLTMPALEDYGVIASAGFSAIHWCQHWSGDPRLYTPAEIDQQRRRLGSAGLRMADLHGYCGPRDHREFSADGWGAVNANRVAFAAALGAAAIVLHLPPPDSRGDPLGATCRMLDALLVSARPAGVRLLLENLGADTTVEFLDAVFSRYGPESVGFCFDSGHANMHRANGYLPRFAGRLGATHLHDNDGSADQHRLPGEGTVDWPFVIGGIRSSGYAGTINLEVGKPPDQPLDAFCREAISRARAIWFA